MGETGSSAGRNGGRLLCMLETYDAIGEEHLLGGPGFSHVCKVAVSSVKAEVWVLPKEKRELAEKMGLLEHLAEKRNQSLEEVERKIDEEAAWRKKKKSCLGMVRG